MAPSVRRVNVSPCCSSQYVSKLLLIHLVLLQLCDIVSGAHVFDAYRLVQFDYEGKEFGSRRTAVNHLVTSLHSVDLSKANDMVPAEETPDPEDDESDVYEEEFEGAVRPSRPSPQSAPLTPPPQGFDLSRKLVVMRIGEASAEVLRKAVNVGQAAGLLVLLPVGKNATLMDHELAQLEHFLLTNVFFIPVYFAFEDSHLTDIFSSLAGSLSTADGYQMVVTAPEAAVVPALSTYNLMGRHHSAPSVDMDAESQPTLALVASFDSFAAAPELAFGMKDSAASSAALLELMRVFSRLYSEVQTQGRVNLLFLLTGGSHLNFAGTQHWLDHADSRVLDTLDSVLCLDALGSSDSDALFLHVSRPGKTEEVTNFYDSFEDTAKVMGIPFKCVHKKINLASKHVTWQHERFSRKLHQSKFVAATLSSREEAVTGLGRASLFDTTSKVSVDRLVRDVKFVAEALSKQVYKFAGKHFDVVADAHAVNEAFLTQWLKFFAAVPRVPAFLTRDSPVLVGLEEAFTKYATNAKRSVVPLANSGYKFYSSAATPMSAYKVKPALFDVVLGIAILSYLGVFHVYLRAQRDFDGSVMQLFGFGRSK